MPFSRRPQSPSSAFVSSGTPPRGRYPSGHGRRTPSFRPTIPVAPPVPARRKPLPEGLIEKMCYEEGVLKPKPDCRAALIDFCILEDDFDIDEAEDAVDKSLRERNLWNEPRLEDILYGDDSETDAAPSSLDPQISSTGNAGS